MSSVRDHECLGELLVLSLLFLQSSCRQRSDIQGETCETELKKKLFETETQKTSTIKTFQAVNLKSNQSSPSDHF